MVVGVCRSHNRRIICSFNHFEGFGFLPQLQGNRKIVISVRLYEELIINWKNPSSPQAPPYYVNSSSGKYILDSYIVL